MRHIQAAHRDFGLGFLYVRPELLGSVLPRVQYGWRQFESFEYHMLPSASPGPYPASWQTVPGAPGYFEMGSFSRTAEACLTHSLASLQRLGVERLLAKLVEPHAISSELVKKLLAWKHPGFSAHVGEPIAPTDKLRREDTAAYLVRNPLSLRELVYLDGQTFAVTASSSSLPGPPGASRSGSSSTGRRSPVEPRP